MRLLAEGIGVMLIAVVLVTATFLAVGSLLFLAGV